MHEHDFDLIMSVAEGTLGESDATRAEAEISGCAQCAEDLALHRMALDALGEAPRVYLTATESARLRAAVRADLRLPTAPDRSRAVLQRRRLRFGVLAGAAAVLLAVVVAAPMVNLLDGEGSTAYDDAFAPLAPALDQESDAAFEAGGAEPPAPAPAPVASESDSSLLAPAPAPAPAEEGLPRLRDDVDIAELKSAVAAAQGAPLPTALADAGLLAERGGTESAVPAEDPSAPEGTPLPDIDRLGTAACDPESLPGAPAGAAATIVGVLDFDGASAIAIAYVSEADGVVRVVIVDSATCEVLDFE
jgi:hypothetical protein